MKPFYYYAMKSGTPKRLRDHFTALVSTIWRGGKEAGCPGEKDGHYDGNQPFLSPNDDGSYDSVKLNVVVLTFDGRTKNQDSLCLSHGMANRQHPT